MFGALIAVVFSVLNYVAKFFLSPIVTGFSNLIPSLTSFFSYILTYLGYGFQFISFIVKLLMIPTVPLTILITFWIGIFAFNLTLHIVGLGLAIFRWFKP